VNADAYTKILAVRLSWQFHNNPFCFHQLHDEYCKNPYGAAAVHAVRLMHSVLEVTLWMCH